jgi:ABC-2 type transport system ATP-binding protein
VLFHVGLGEAVYRDVQEYSTGMRQRFKLAQAIVHDPEILFLDEPLSGLDPEGRDELLELIRDLARRQGKHVVWSSHILPEVQKVADTVIVLDRGECRGTFRLDGLRGPSGELEVEVEGDAGRFEAALQEHGIAATRHPREAEAALGGPLPVTGRTHWTARLPEGQGPSTLLRVARDAGLRVRRLVPRGDSLEEAFHRLVGAGKGGASR